MSEPLLQLEGVTKRFGGTVAADGLSLTVAAGRVTGLIGPNGAGKSTVVNLIAGRWRPDAGTIRFRGGLVPPTPHGAARLGIGRLFQEVRIFESLTVLENVLVGAPGQAGEGVWATLGAPRRLGRELRQATAAALEQLALVNLADRAGSLAGSLSYGQQKLVAIARLLVTGAELLLLDEPASGVHPRLIEELADLLARLLAAGRTILLVEHNMALVQAVCHDLILLDHGRCRAAGPAAKVWASDVLHEVYLAPADQSAP